MSGKRSTSPEAIRRMARVIGRVERATSKATRTVSTRGFPYRAPTVPGGVQVPKEPPRLGADFDTDFARRPAARVARVALTEGPVRLAVRALASPEVLGTDRLGRPPPT
jgi:1-acyl-sn-glycerol-3-phosphate acyltransferase